MYVADRKYLHKLLTQEALNILVSDDFEIISDTDAHTGHWTGFTVVVATVFTSMTTGEGAKSNIGTHTFPANFSCFKDIRAIKLTSGVIMAHKINE